MHFSYIKETSSKSINIKFGDVDIKYVICFKNKKRKKKSNQSDNLKNLSKFGPYEYEGLPKITKILIYGCLLIKPEIMKHLELMNEENELTYKSYERRMQTTMTEYIIKVLVEDLVSQ